MKYIKDKVENINIAYIGRGSTEWAWKIMSDLALEESLSGTIKLFDINYEAAYANEIIGNKLFKRNEVKGKWKYKAVKSLKEAILNADIVFISILPGTFQEMKSDVHLPEEYGIYQSGQIKETDTYLPTFFLGLYCSYILARSSWEGQITCPLSPFTPLYRR